MVLVTMAKYMMNMAKISMPKKIRTLTLKAEKDFSGDVIADDTFNRDNFQAGMICHVITSVELSSTNPLIHLIPAKGMTGKRRKSGARGSETF